MVHQTEDQVFVHPLTAPYYHEDSFVTSDLRLWYAYHNFPKSGLLNGGYANVYAVQLRLALTERIQFVAYKDGYTDLNTGLGLTHESGWNDIAAGLKWNFLQDWDHQLHAALGVGYELKTGQGKVFQNDDEVRVWGSVNKGFGKLHLGGTLNYLYAPDKDRGLGDGDRVMAHVHADYWACKWFSPVVEANAYYVTDEGPLKLPIQGADVLNLGGGEDEEIVTLGLGGEFRPFKSLKVRAAYEMPLTKNEDIFGYRWTFSSVLSF